MVRSLSSNIRNSTADFLIFTLESGEGSIEVRYEDKTIWLSQKMMALLFDLSIPTINEHLTSIYESGELTREATIRKFQIVQREGNRDVTRNIDYYNLDVVISVGYRVNFIRATRSDNGLPGSSGSLLSKGMPSIKNGWRMVKFGRTLHPSELSPLAYTELNTITGFKVKIPKYGWILPLYSPR